MTKDTKGVRQVLERLAWAGKYTDAGQDVVSSNEVDKAEATLQEIMLGMLPEKKEWGKLEDPYDNPDIQQGFNEAVDEMEQNIRGGFNNG